MGLYYLGLLDRRWTAEQTQPRACEDTTTPDATQPTSPTRATTKRTDPLTAEVDRCGYSMMLPHDSSHVTISVATHLSVTRCTTSPLVRLLVESVYAQLLLQSPPVKQIRAPAMPVWMSKSKSLLIIGATTMLCPTPKR